MSERIEIRDGKAYAVSEYPLFTQPILRRLFVLLDVDPDVLSQGARVENLRDGTYYAECGTLRKWRTVRRYNQDPEAVAEIIEESPIPPPKTKAPVRWDGGKGSWERLTRKGWN